MLAVGVHMFAVGVRMLVVALPTCEHLSAPEYLLRVGEE